MRSRYAIITTLLLLTGCSTPGEVRSIKPDTFVVTSEQVGQIWSSWSDLQESTAEQATLFCREQHKTMTPVDWKTHGVRGWGMMSAELAFRCDRSVASPHSEPAEAPR